MKCVANVPQPYTVGKHFIVFSQLAYYSCILRMASALTLITENLHRRTSDYVLTILYSLSQGF